MKSQLLCQSGGQSLERVLLPEVSVCLSRSVATTSRSTGTRRMEVFRRCSAASVGVEFQFPLAFSNDTTTLRCYLK